MKFVLYAVVVLAGLLVAVVLVAAAALFLTIRDEIRRRRETDLPPRIAVLRQDFFREDIDMLRGVKLWFLWYVELMGSGLAIMHQELMGSGLAIMHHGYGA